jgi:hypothetical protein
MTSPVRSAANRSSNAGAAERPLGDEAGRRAVKGNPEALQLIDGRDGFAAHQLGGGLVGQVVASLDGVEGVFFPVVVFSLGAIPKPGVDPSLGGDGVGAERVDPGDDGQREPRVGAEDGRKTGQSAADDQDVVRDHQ